MFFYNTQYCIAIVNHMLAIIATVLYWWGDLSWWVWLIGSTAKDHILTVQYTAVAIYSMADSPTFKHLKNCFLSEPVLSLPNNTRTFAIATDASKHASGGYSSKQILMATDILVPISLGCSPLPNETMTFMIMNSLLLFMN